MDKITTAVLEDIPALRELFRVSFSAQEEELDLFFSMRFAPLDTLVYRRNGALLAALYLWDCDVACAGKRLGADYIYAAATCEELRRQGIMAKLLDYAAEYSRGRGRDFLLLSPADSELFSYYGKRGFSNAFYAKCFTLSRKTLSLLARGASGKGITTGADSIRGLWACAYSRADGVVWSREVLEYDMALLKLAAVGSGDKLRAYAFWQQEYDGAVQIVDAQAQAGSVPALAAELLRQSDADFFEFALPSDFPLSVDDFSIEPVGMLRPLSAAGESSASLLRNAYMGLTMA
ncbi:MAG: GNAT family N-acetyltransferase [Clostridium sp.]|jgi:GNAT superfamily N-acetyltransferase|nr:GNAT family N-acetyltransferase [Clostridium sp.]